MVGQEEDLYSLITLTIVYNKEQRSYVQYILTTAGVKVSPADKLYIFYHKY